MTLIFSFEQQKAINPQTAAYYANVIKVEKSGDREVTFTFDVKGNRELPQILGQLTIMPKHYLVDQRQGRQATGSVEGDDGAAARLRSLSHQVAGGGQLDNL